jgi:hypothetical protein
VSNCTSRPRSGLNAEKFLVLEDGRRYYRTRDLGRFLTCAANVWPNRFRSRDGALAALKAQLEADPDGRLLDHCQRWQGRTGQALSVATLHRARRALAGRKRKLTASERDEAERAGWRQEHGALKPTDLVFVDISGSNLALAPRCGWAPKASAPGARPANCGQNTTVSAAMTHEGLLTSMTVEGAANTEALLTYLDCVALPGLAPRPNRPDG